MTSAFYLHDCTTKSCTYGILKGIRISRVGVRFGKLSSIAENLVWQVLEFWKINVCREISAGSGISRYWPNDLFVEGFI